MEEVNEKTNNEKLAFVSDTVAGAHEKVFEQMIKDNKGYSGVYGDDHVCDFAKQLLTQFFPRVNKENIYWVSTGTAANVLGLAAMTSSHSLLICSENSHLNTDEAAAPETILGLKLFPVKTNDGKLFPVFGTHPQNDDQAKEIKKILKDKGIKRRAQPKIITISQTTELGTIYSPSEIDQIADWAHSNDLFLHLDGSRLFNAAVSIGVPVEEFTKKVDVLSLGLTKNGSIDCEIILLLNSSLPFVSHFPYIIKGNLSLQSKTRFKGSQTIAMLTSTSPSEFDEEGDKKEKMKKALAYETAAHANKMMQIFVTSLLDKNILKKEDILYPVEANCLIVNLRNDILKVIKEEYLFVVIYEGDFTSHCRFMTSWATTQGEIDRFVAFCVEKILPLL